MRNLIKKILKEDDFQWMKDIEPHFFDILEYVTKDDPRINVRYSSDKNFYEVTDELDYLYFDDYELEQFLLDYQYGPLNINNIKQTKEPFYTLLRTQSMMGCVMKKIITITNTYTR